MQSSFDGFDNDENVHYEDGSEFSQSSVFDDESEDVSLRSPRSMWDDGDDARDASPSSRSGGGSPDVRKRMILREVNEVLNQQYPQKTLFSSTEFDDFRELVIGRVDGWNDENLGDFVRGIEISGATASGRSIVEVDETNVDECVDAVLKDLFFHAGGTLVGVLKPRSERLHGAVASNVNATVSSSTSADDVGSTGMTYRLSTGETEEYDSSVSNERNGRLVFADRPWSVSCSKLEEIFERFFGNGPLDVNDIVTLRRLFFLGLDFDLVSSCDPSDSAFVSLDEDVMDSVDEAFDLDDGVSLTRDGFVFVLLEKAYENLNNRVLLEQKASSEFDTITLLILYYLGRRFDASDEKILSVRSDFDLAYRLVADYLVSERFANRQFNSDLSDFDDFVREFENVVGSHVHVPTSTLVDYFREVGGRFMETPSSASEPVSILSRAELIKKVVAEDFPSGLDVYSSDDLSRFVEICAGHGVTLNLAGDKLRAAICRCTTLVDRRVYSITDKNKKDLKQKIEALFRVGVSVVYYEAYFEKYKSRLIAMNVVNWRVLRAILASCFSKYYFYEYYFESTLSTLTEFGKVRSEILRLWGGAKVVSVETLAERGNVPSDRILRALEVDSDEFSPNGNDYLRVSSDGAFLFNVDEYELNAKFVRAFDYVLPDGAMTGKEFVAFLNGESANGAKSVRRSGDLSETRNLIDTVDASPRCSGKLGSDRVKGSDDDADGSRTDTPEKLRSRRKSDSRSKSVLSNSLKVDSDDWRKYANLVARILSTSFKEGLGLSEVDLFREKASDFDLSLSDSDEEVLNLLKRVGFVCGERIYVVSQKTKAAVMELVDAWFALGGSVIFYASFFERHHDLLVKGGVPSVDVLENRLRKYYPDSLFADGYFGVIASDERSLESKIREDVFAVWDGSSSKRLNDLVDAVYVPRDILEETLSSDSENFTVRSNGYWSRVMKGAISKKRVIPRRKTAKRRLDSES